MAENLYHHEFNPFYEWGPYGANVVAAESTWKRPLKWDRLALEGVCLYCHGRGSILVDATKIINGEPELIQKEQTCKPCGGIGNTEPYRARVFCVADLFDNLSGPITNTRGEQLWLDTRNAPTWFSGNETDANQLSRQANVRPLTMQDVRERVFRLIDATPHLDWMVLTKRPENIAGMMPDFVLNHNSDGQGHDETSIRPNLWLGTSVENQQTANERSPHLLKVPAKVLFLSCEPLLGPVDLSRIDTDHDVYCDPLRGEYTQHVAAGLDHPGAEQTFPDGPRIHLVIAGGESGPKARPCNIAWLRSLRDQCREAGLAFFLKQVGSKPYEFAFDGPAVRSWGDTRIVPNGLFVQIHLKDFKGGNPLEWPEDLRVREMP